MLKFIFVFILTTTSVFAAPKIVSISASPRIQNTPDVDPSIIHAAGLIEQLKWGATFQCGHVNPRPTGKGNIEVSEIKTPGQADRYLVEVSIDFEC